MRKILIIGLVVVFLIFIGLISSYNYYISQKKVTPTPTPVEKETPPETPKITLPKILYNLAGTIQKIDKGSLLFEATIPLLDEKGQPITKTETRKVMITPNTKFTRLTFVEVEPGRKTPQETLINFRNLKLEDYIEVISNRDISQAEEFEATQIRVLPTSF